MEQSLAVTDDLMGRIDRALSATTGAACVCLTLPDLHLGGLPRGLQGACYWERPEAGQRLLALGCAWRAEASGPARFATLREEMRAFSDNLMALDPDRTALPPRFLLSATFSAAVGGQGGPSASVWLPQLVVEETGGRCRLVAASPGDWQAHLERLLRVVGNPRPVRLPLREPVRVAEIPSSDVWLKQARRAVADIRRGDLEKVVLARCIELRGPRPYDPARLVRLLGDRHPRATLFALDTGEGHLVAATPERLLSARGGNVQCDALAGTAPRDTDPDRDRRLGALLLADAKNLHEHRVVVDALRHALAAHCVESLAPAAPVLYRTSVVQHLHTPVGGRLRPGQDPLSLAQTLHPTPAVGGAPKKAALDWLGSHESLDRGWFAGLAGWLDKDGNAELSVLLRCALLRGNRAVVHAGAGLVADSDPKQEWAETELKMSVMLQALREA